MEALGTTILEMVHWHLRKFAVLGADDRDMCLCASVYNLGVVVFFAMYLLGPVDELRYVQRAGCTSPISTTLGTTPMIVVVWTLVEFAMYWTRNPDVLLVGGVNYF